MKRRIIASKIIIILLLLLNVSCLETVEKKETAAFNKNNLEGKNIVESIDYIALTDPMFEDYRSNEIYEVLSKVADPKQLFEYFVLFNERKNKADEQKYIDDVKCLTCHRYEIAMEVVFVRLEEIKSDEAIKYTVLILEKELVSGHAHLSEELFESVIEFGEPTLKYLRKIEKTNYLAKRAIEEIERQKTNR